MSRDTRESVAFLLCICAAIAPWLVVLRRVAEMMR